MMGNLLKDRYQLVDELGQGGMGVVYHARDTVLDRDVAVKVLSSASRTRMGTDGAARLLHEAQAAARLNHPNIVSIYDAGEDHGASFIVMELIEGESLFERRPASLRDSLAILRQVCTALEHAHTNGIVHRDLKPENILVTPDGKVKLTDFGLARSVTSRLTLEGAIVGTVLYLAPETALRQPYDHRVDLYSLGVILYELTCGVLPYNGDEPLAVISQHLYAPVVPPRAHNPAIPPALEQLILQLMNKNPAQRPQSAAEVGRALDLLLGVGLVESVEPGLPQPGSLDRLVRGRLVGRERELKELNNTWAAAVKGNGRVMLLSGEPGIGKSRLARELVARARISGGRVLNGACYPEGGVPYAPFPQIIQEAVEGAPGLQLGDDQLHELAKIAPALRSRLAGAPPPPLLDPVSEQQHIFEAVTGLFNSLSDQAPLLLFIDDAHWADSSALVLLRHLARRARDRRLLILLTYREIAVEDISIFQQVLNDLTRERLASRLKLTRFDCEQTGALLGILLAPHANMDPRLVDAIYMETEGNPYFIEEVCKALLEAGRLCLDSDVWCALDPEDIVIPQSVRLTLQTRLTRLSPNTQEALRMAAILGREFDFPTLLQATEMDEEDLISALEAAEHAQIITEAPDRNGAAAFVFAHGLIPTTLRENASSLRRQRLHRRAARAIESLRPQDVESIAYHYENAGEATHAREYYDRAASRALSIYANQEAERYYQAAIDLCEQQEKPAHLHAGLGEALYRQSKYAPAAEAYLAAAELYRRENRLDEQALMAARAARATWHSGNSPRSLQICQEALQSIPNAMQMETPGVAALIHETGRAYRFNQMNEQALPLCQHALQLARRLNLVEVQAETLSTLGILPNQPAEQIRAALEEAVRLSESGGLLMTALRAHTNLGEYLRIWGEFEAARGEFLRGVELGRRVGSTSWEHDQLFSATEISIDLADYDTVDRNLPILKSLQENLPHRKLAEIATRSLVARLLRFRGEWEQAEPALLASLEENLAHEFYWMSAGLVSVLADLYVEMGRMDDARIILERHNPDHPEVSPIDHIIPLGLLSVIAVQNGQPEKAAELLEKAQRLVDEHKTSTGWAIQQYTRARLHILQREWQPGFETFAALEQALEQAGVRWYQARMCSEWADAHLKRGLPENIPPARQLYQKAIRIFDELKLPRYRQRVEAKLNGVNMHPTQFEFHVSRQARDRYQFDESLFSLSGNVLFANFHGARTFAQKMNQKLDLVSFPEQAVRAGQINALGLVDEILHLLAAQYRREHNPQAMAQALETLQASLGTAEVDAALRAFAVRFPPLAVYRRDVDVDAYLQGSSGEIPNRQILLEELLMLWVANSNPACAPFMELFDDAELETKSIYPQMIKGLQAFFAAQPAFGPDDQTLVEMLRAPAIAVPHSLPGQLEYIRTRWGQILGQMLYRLLSSLDLIKEEEKIYFTNLGPAPALVYEFGGQDYALEAEAFSPDRDWMPGLVLLAKNAFVWLDQLTRQYGRPIDRLDLIPDEELERLGRSGFTGLWLIGLWERSAASKTIKQLRGNPDAVASAYSLFDYSIAYDLGGEDAYRVLRDRAWKYGVRLASDMVPNHMGIDSRWVVEHPDWFIYSHESPFPSYSFNGPDLSWDERIELKIDDHYFDNSDAAVVFRRVDRWSGDTRYIYHGNDGTSMPWNDTAQLNYLLPEVREAVIQTILHVARKFPIIRFDAAMTLAKRHFQRLWFPEPGSGGDIPSRAEHALTREQFEAAIPVEFWREVVDRVAREVPDTLLLAEAFWLMEGYFVRTLGMHRVYNSAFMNMMRDEKNREYRQVIKNTIEFDPEILKRYVNFMNNPDERTAVDQFGKGDKYFGVSTLLATLPGLPMFGHGQVEGFTEKYGMEYRRAYWDERPDGYLVERHQREIFPLLRKRYLFGEARDFVFYDFLSAPGSDAPAGSVNEDVFAYSNRAGNEHALVVFHNKYARAYGWIRNAAARPPSGNSPASLGEALGLHNQAGYYSIFRDVVSGLEYIRPSLELHQSGLYITLEAYKYQVFMDFREVQEDLYHQYGQLVGYLNGRGVPSIEDALKEVFLQVLHHPFRELVNRGSFEFLLDSRSRPPAPKARKTKKAAALAAEAAAAPALAVPAPDILEQALDEIDWKMRAILLGVQTLTGGAGSVDEGAAAVRAEAAALLRLPALTGAGRQRTALKFAQSPGLLNGERRTWGVLLGWLATHRLGDVQDPAGGAELSRTWVDEWLLGKIIAGVLGEMGLDHPTSERSISLVRLLTSHQAWFDPQIPAARRAHTALQGWLRDQEVQRLLGVNRFQGLLWFNKEAYDEWLWWMFLAAVVRIQAAGATPEEQRASLLACFTVIETLQKAEAASKFQVDKLLEAARG